MPCLEARTPGLGNNWLNHDHCGRQRWQEQTTRDWEPCGDLSQSPFYNNVLPWISTRNPGWPSRLRILNVRKTARQLVPIEEAITIGMEAETKTGDVSRAKPLEKSSLLDSRRHIEKVTLLYITTWWSRFPWLLAMASETVTWMFSHLL